VIVENVLLRDVQLPAMLKGSIEAKQQAEQDALRMSFILQKENRKPSGSASKRRALRIFRGSWRRASVRNCSNGRALRRRRSWRQARMQGGDYRNPKNGLPLVLERSSKS